MLLRIVALMVLTEAIVELIFTAAPIQGIRAWLIKKTPWLRSNDYGHLLDCKYCTSVWVAPGVLAGYYCLDCRAIEFLGVALIVARLSNYAHLLYGSLHDAQLNMRLRR